MLANLMASMHSGTNNGAVAGAPGGRQPAPGHLPNPILPNGRVLLRRQFVWRLDATSLQPMISALWTVAKVLLFLFLFNPDASASRIVLMCFAGLLFHLWQSGTLQVPRFVTGEQQRGK